MHTKARLLRAKGGRPVFGTTQWQACVTLDKTTIGSGAVKAILNLRTIFHALQIVDVSIAYAPLVVRKASPVVHCRRRQRLCSIKANRSGCIVTTVRVPRVEYNLDHCDRICRWSYCPLCLAGTEWAIRLYSHNCARSHRRIRCDFYWPDRWLVSARSRRGTYRCNDWCSDRAVHLEQACGPPCHWRSGSGTAGS